MITVHLLCVLLVLLLGQEASCGPVPGPGDTSASVRDAHSCAHYYSWVKNQHYGTWELERKQCPAELYFEPTLNVCKPADQLVIKCSNNSPTTPDQASVSNSRRVRQHTTRDKRYSDLSDNVEDLKYSIDEIPDKSMSSSNPEELQSGGKKLPFRRHRGNGSSAKQGTKRRKNSNNKANKKRNKKNWVAIFVRGCNSRFGDSPFDDDDEQPDEQLEEDENENQTNEDAENGEQGGNQTNEPHNSNELGNGSNENGTRPNPRPSGATNEKNPDESRQRPSSNCTCGGNPQSTTSKPDCNHHENLTGSSATPSASTTSAPTSSTDQKLSGSTGENSPSISTTSAPNGSPSGSSPSAPSSTNKPTNLQSSTATKPPVTSARPSSTPSKPKPSRIVLIPLKITNPHNNKNSTGKVDEKEALRRFLEELKKKRPGLSKESEKQLALLFKAKVRKNDEKNKEPVDRSFDQIEPAMGQSKNGKEPDVKDLKLEKIEEEIGIELDDAFNYYTNLADKGKTNSTG